MKPPLQASLRFAFILCVCTCTSQALAQVTPKSLADLVDTGQLLIRSWIEPADEIVVGEEIQLTIEVSTQRWFAGGTTIRYPDEKNLVILRRDTFANNLSRREGAMTWVIQRWNLELYPQAEGHYRLPPIELEVAVNDATAGVVRGALQTGPLEFEAHVPAALAGVKKWLATPMLSLEHELDREAVELVPGDAFTRQINLRATHVTAMMLPPVHASEVPGLAAYEDTPQLRDTSNRGEATAERRQSITYVVEQAGQYLLPAQVFYWWDTSNRELKTVVLPELSIDAGIAASSSAGDEPTPAGARLRERLARSWLLLLLPATIVGLGLLLWRRWPAHMSEATLLRQVSRALRRGESEQAARLLYHWLNSFRPQPDWYQLRTALARDAGTEAAEQVDRLLARAYGGTELPGPVMLKQLKPTRIGWLAGILRQLLLKPVKLKLNPGDSAGE